MKISLIGIELIKLFEGYNPKVYLDVAGIRTIGWGHVVRASEGFSIITQSDAESLLRHDLEDAESAVEEECDTLTQQQADALISFTFNLGRMKLRSSTLLRLHNLGKFQEAANEFPKWCHADGKVIAGLLARRNIERKVYLLGDYGTLSSANIS